MKGFDPLEKYSMFVSHHPKTVIALAVVAFVIAGISASQVKVVSQDNSDFLPKDLETVKAFGLLEGITGTQTTIEIAVELDPNYAGSNEPRDIRDPEVIRYIDLLSRGAAETNRVTSVSSPSTLLKEANGGVLPQSRREIIDLVDASPLMFQYISPDDEMALIRMDLEGASTSEQISDLVSDLQGMIDLYPRPPGLDVNVAGSLAVSPQIESELGPDISRTSMLSFVGIIIVLLLLFGSVRYGLMPLSVIVIGVVWAIGYLGLVGISLTDSTSGVISMIMGIGIDFGIQVTMRFRQELSRLTDPSKAMTVTLNNVFMPMATTTLAALLGFSAMASGQLTLMAQFGGIMSIGILFTFFAALTVVPAVLVVSDSLCQRFSRICRGPAGHARSFMRRVRKTKGGR